MTYFMIDQRRPASYRAERRESVRGAILLAIVFGLIVSADAIVNWAIPV